MNNVLWSVVENTITWLASFIGHGESVQFPKPEEGDKTCPHGFRVWDCPYCK